MSKFASINQIGKFLVDLDPHWYFGKITFPNNETTPIEFNRTPKGGLGGNHVLTPSDDSKKLILKYFFEQDRGLTQVGVNRDPQDPHWALSTKDEIGPQNPIQRNFV